MIDFPENRGKRAAMAAGIRATSAEVVVFVDSDSTVEPEALKRLVQPLADARVGAVCGHANVLNVRDTWITRMQAVRYFVAFRVVKAAESVFGAVTCCSGCFSAYRRAAILPRLEWWENQTFLGVESTFGDDRSLTNCVLRDWRILYERRAVSHTIVPITFRAFLKQQTRWKRSWTRESLLVAKFIWRKHPVAALLRVHEHPAAAARADRRGALARVGAAVTHHGVLPLTYLAGIYALALVYSFYFLLFQDRYNVLWLYGILFVFFYLGDHAVADLLRDRHLPHRRVGHATRDRRPRRRGRGGVGDGVEASRCGHRPGSRSGARSRRCCCRSRCCRWCCSRPRSRARRRRSCVRLERMVVPAHARVYPAPYEPPRYPPGASRLERDIFAPVAGILTPQVGVSALAEHQTRQKSAPTRRSS